MQSEVDRGIANDGDKLKEVQLVSDVYINLYSATRCKPALYSVSHVDNISTRGDDECHFGNLPNVDLEINLRNSFNVENKETLINNISEPAICNEYWSKDSFVQQLSL